MNKLSSIIKWNVLRKTLFVFVAMCMCTVAVFAQGIQISGTVTDDTGGSLPGASIQVQGTNIGIVTDANGKYSINVPNRDAVLVFSFVGFSTQEIAVGSQNIVNVTLVEGVEIEEVVVTALGIKKQAKALSYSATEMKGEDIANTPELNLMNSLQGLVAGVDVTSLGTGAAGSSSVTIRGNTSISRDNNPMYVIDGVPIMRNSRSNNSRDLGDAMTTLNPNDIESMSILKGAAATALYGSRASNGVILITTKNGLQQKGLGISYFGSFGIESYDDALKGRQTLYGNSGSNGDNSSAYLYSWNAETHRDWGPRFDGRRLVGIDSNFAYNSNAPLTWNNDQDKPLYYDFKETHWKQFMRAGLTANNSLSLTGGGGNNRYRISFSDLRYNAPVPNSNMNRQTISVSTNSRIAKIVTLNTRINYSTAKTKNRPNPGRYVAQMQVIPTNIPIEWLKGDPNKWGANTSGDGKMLSFSTNDYFNNPWWSAYQDSQTDTRNRLAANADLRIEIAPWLFVTGRMGIETQTMRNEDVEADGFLRGNNSGRGRIQQFMQLNNEFNADYGIVFNKAFGKFDVSAMFGGSLTRNSEDRDGLQGDGMVIEYWNVITNAGNINMGSNNTFVGNSKSGINSLYGSAEISYNNFIYLTVTGRNDWFSSLPVSQNNVFYPSVGLSYLLSQHISLPNWWTFAKLRASYAEVGGGAGAYQTKLQYNINSQGYLGYPYVSIPETLNNPLLMPYNTREYEIGFDFRFFNNRVGIDYAYYDKKTTNDIVTVNVPQASGYNNARVNLGSIGNKGHELMLSLVPVKTKDWQWSFNIAYAFNKGEILSLGDVDEVNQQSVDQGGGIDIKHIVGKQPYAVYGYTHRTENGQKVWTKQAMTTPDVQGYNVWYPGKKGTKDLLGYGINPNAGSISTQVRWKNFTLSAMIDAKWGATMVYTTEQQMIERGTSKQTLPGRDGGLFIDGVYNTGTASAPVWTDVKSVPEYTITQKPQNFLSRDLHVKGNEMPYELKFFEQYYRYGQGAISELLTFDGSYVKFRQVSLGYNLPKSIFGNVPIQGAYVSFVARNLFDLYNKLPAGDPSISRGNGLSDNLLPNLKTFTLNLNVNF